MVEREYKVLISKNIYHNLSNKFQDITDKKYTQINFIYDTDDLIFNKNNITLRIRSKNKKLTLEVKKMQSVDRFLKISEEKRKSLNFLPAILDDDEENFLKEYEFPFSYKNVKLKGCLITNRQTIVIEDGIKIDIDKNIYLGRIDYELELEFISEKAKIADEFFRNLLNDFFICKPINSKGKRARFFERYRQLLEIDNDIL